MIQGVSNIKIDLLPYRTIAARLKNKYLATKNSLFVPNFLLSSPLGLSPLSLSGLEPEDKSPAPVGQPDSPVR